MSSLPVIGEEIARVALASEFGRASVSGMPWGAEARAGSVFRDPSLLAAAACRLFYEDDLYHGPTSEVLDLTGGLDSTLEWAFVSGKGDWGCRLTRKVPLTARRAVGVFLSRCRAVTERTPIVNMPGGQACAVCFASAFAEAHFSRPSMDAALDVDKVAEDANREYGADVDEMKKFTMLGLCQSVSKCLVSVVACNSYRGFGKSRDTVSLQDIRSSIDEVLGVSSPDSVPTKVPKPLYPVFCLRVATVNEDDKYNGVSGSQKLADEILVYSRSSRVFRRKDVCPVGMSEAVAWAADQVKAAEDKRLSDVFTQEVFWTEIFESQLICLNHLLVDVMRRSISFVGSCKRRTTDAALQASSKWIDLISNYAPKAAGGRILRTVNHVMQFAAMGKSRCLSRSLRQLQSNRLSRGIGPILREHLFHMVRLEMQIHAMCKMILASCRETLRRSLERIRSTIEHFHSVKIDDLAMLSTVRHPNLQATADRLRASTASSILVNEAASGERMSMVDSSVSSAALTSMVLAMENGEHGLELMGADLETPKTVDGAESRRVNFVTVCEMNRGAASRGIFCRSSRKPEDIEGMYSEMSLRSPPASRSVEILDPRRLAPCPHELWFDDYKKAVAPMQKILLSRREILEEKPKEGKLICDFPEVTNLQPWVSGSRCGKMGRDSLLRMVRMMNSATANTAVGGVLSALEQWVPPSWALFSEVESDDFLRGLMGGSLAVTPTTINTIVLVTDPMPKWAVVLLFQEPRLGVELLPGSRVAIRGPLAGVTIALDRDAMLMKLDTMKPVSDGSANVFSILVQTFLKVVDTLRSMTRKRSFKPRQAPECERKCEVALDAALAEADPKQDQEADWNILLTNLIRMQEEEHDSRSANGKRRFLGRLFGRLVKRADRAFESYASRRSAETSLARTRRRDILLRLPLEAQLSEIRKAKDRVIRKLGGGLKLSKEEALLLVRAKSSSVSEETLSLCAAVLSAT